AALRLGADTGNAQRLTEVYDEAVLILVEVPAESLHAHLQAERKRAGTLAQGLRGIDAARLHGLREMHGLPSGLTIMQVRIRRSECCGNAQCVETLPSVFALDSKNKAVVLDPEAASEPELLEAAADCPCQAI